MAMTSGKLSEKLFVGLFGVTTLLCRIGLNPKLIRSHQVHLCERSVLCIFHELMIPPLDWIINPPSFLRVEAISAECQVIHIHHCSQGGTWNLLLFVLVSSSSPRSENLMLVGLHAWNINSSNLWTFFGWLPTSTRKLYKHVHCSSLIWRQALELSD